VSVAVQVPELTDEQREYIAKQQATKEEATAEDVEAKGPTSFFHGKKDKDYQVRGRDLPPRISPSSACHVVILFHICLPLCSCL
jgi:pre-mRNA-processing factor 17